jgi:hypothetical protein
MSVVQECARARQFPFFHPDYLTVIARSSDSGTFMTIKAEFLNAEEIKLNFILHSGSEDVLTDFERGISESL